jgi:hypothetical protein
VERVLSVEVDVVVVESRGVAVDVEAESIADVVAVDVFESVVMMDTCGLPKMRSRLPPRSG